MTGIAGVGTVRADGELRRKPGIVVDMARLEATAHLAERIRVHIDKELKRVTTAAETSACRERPGDTACVRYALIADVLNRTISTSTELSLVGMRQVDRYETGECVLSDLYVVSQASLAASLKANGLPPEEADDLAGRLSD